MASPSKTPAAGKKSRSNRKPSAAVIEDELVEIFSDLARLLGNPPSCGAIYGLLFASEQPLSMDEIIARLDISKGSASQGLRQLSEIGAIARSNGDRPARYRAELELRLLLAGFLREQLTPRIENAANRLGELKKMLPLLPDGARANATARIGKLSAWHERAMSTVPLALQLLQND